MKEARKKLTSPPASASLSERMKKVFHSLLSEETGGKKFHFELTEFLRGDDRARMLNEFHLELEVLGDVGRHEALVGVPDGTHELERPHLVHTWKRDVAT